MARKSTKYLLNPVRRVRVGNHKSLHNFGLECGVHWQVVFLSEAGVYPEINASIKRRLITHYDQDPVQLNSDYKTFVKASRLRFAATHQPYELPAPNVQVSPIKALREDIFNLSKMGFCKSICVQPALISRVESGKSINLPGQLKEALEEASFPVGWIEELEYRNQEHYFYKTNGY